MKDKTSKIVHTVFGAVFGAYTAVVAALLIWQTVDIYRDGRRSASGVIFSRGIVGERLTAISPALWIWVALAAVGFALGIIFVTKARVAKQDLRYTLYRLRKRMPAQAPENMSACVKTVRREDTLLRILWSVVGAVGLAGAIYTVVYLAMPSHFPKANVTKEMLALVKHVIPWVSWTFILACAVGVYERFSAGKQIPAVRELVKNGTPAVREQNKIFGFLTRYGVWMARGAAGVIAVAFVIAGAVNGGAHDVLVKAVNICTECIGLG